MPITNKEQFLNENCGIIKKFANKYYFETSKFSFEDLVQVGNKAAIKAIDSYDETLGFKPLTYIGKAIDRDVRDFVRNNKFDAFISGSEQKKMWKKFKETGVKPEFGPNHPTAVRLDWNWDSPPSGEEDNSFANTIPSGSPPPENQMMVDEQKEILLEEIQRLPENERKVIMGKHFNNISFVCLGADLGVSRQRAQQIEQQAFETLKTRLGNRLGNFIARSDGLSRK